MYSLLTIIRIAQLYAIGSLLLAINEESPLTQEVGPVLLEWEDRLRLHYLYEIPSGHGMACSDIDVPDGLGFVTVLIYEDQDFERHSF